MSETLPRSRLIVLLVVPRFHTNLYFAVKSLTEAGHVVRLWCTDGARLEDHSTVRPDRLDGPRSFADIRHRLDELRPDLVLLRDVKGFSRTVFLAGLTLNLRMVGYDQHPMTRVRSLRKRVSDMVRGRPLQRMTPVPGLNADAPRDPGAHYIPFPVEGMVDTTTRTVMPEGVLRVLCVGKLTQRRKNQDLLITAIARLATPRVRLTLVGSSSLEIGGGSAEHFERLRAAALSGPMAGRLEILADVPFREMPHVYARHDLCVLPSIAEPLGTSPLEAMAYGTVPVISTGCGTAGYIPDEDHGAIVEAGSIESLSAALTRFVDNPFEVARVGAHARILAQTEFGPRRFVERIEALATERRIPFA